MCYLEDFKKKFNDNFLIPETPQDEREKLFQEFLDNLSSTPLFPVCEDCNYQFEDGENCYQYYGLGGCTSLNYCFDCKQKAPEGFIIKESKPITIETIIKMQLLSFDFPELLLFSGVQFYDFCNQATGGFKYERQKNIITKMIQLNLIDADHFDL